jgi:hypothetical protein
MPVDTPVLPTHARAIARCLSQGEGGLQRREQASQRRASVQAMRLATERAYIVSPALAAQREHDSILAAGTPKRLREETDNTSLDSIATARGEAATEHDHL